MGPLIALGVSLLPDLARWLWGDTAGRVTTQVADAVTQMAGTADSAAARARLDADPALATQLRVELAKIAAEAEKVRLDAEETRRQAEHDELRAEIRDRASARTSMVSLDQQRSAPAWAPAVVSGVVIFVAFIRDAAKRLTVT